MANGGWRMADGGWLIKDHMEKRKKLAPTHKIVGIFDRKQYIEQMTACLTRRARLSWHNGKLLAKAAPGDTVEILTTDGDPTPIRVTEQQIKVADHLFSRYEWLEDYIAEEVELAYRDTGNVDGEQYVLEEVRGEHAIENAIAIYERRGFRDVRAVPITETQ
jgi:hypothetical protein